MSYIIPPGFSRITFEYAAVSTAGSRPVWGLGVAHSPDPVIMASLVEWVDEELQTITSNSATIERIVMRNDVEIEEELVNFPGGLVSSFGPPSNSALISLSTGLVGRQNRGRIYLPFVLPEADLDGGGVISGERVSHINDAFGDLLDRMTTLAANPVILHSSSSDPTPITSWKTQTLSATQRRRLRA